MLAQAETEHQSFSMPCAGCKTWVKGWRHYTHVQGQFFCGECVRHQQSGVLSSASMLPGSDAAHFKAGGAAAEMVKVPPCWDLLGAPRWSWTVGGYIWDCFGFSLHSDTWVVMNAFAHAQMCIAEVDYAHGVHLGPEARVQLSVWGMEDQALLSELCTLRSVRHWIRVWRRSCRRRRLQREKSFASRIMKQYCRGGADSTSLVHSFLCG